MTGQHPRQTNSDCSQQSEHPPRLVELVQRRLLEAHAPASVLINGKHEGLYYFGATDRYLQVAPGEASRDILAMAREGLRAKLRAAIRRAAEENVRTMVTGAHVNRDGSPVGVSIAVIPVLDVGEALFLVSFIDEPGCYARPAATPEAASDSQIAQLEQELDATRVDLHDARRDLKIANEGHKALYGVLPFRPLAGFLSQVPQTRPCDCGT